MYRRKISRDFSLRAVVCYSAEFAGQQGAVSAGSAAGAAIGAIVAVAAIAGIVFFIYRYEFGKIIYFYLHAYLTSLCTVKALTWILSFQCIGREYFICVR